MSYKKQLLKKWLKKWDSETISLAEPFYAEVILDEACSEVDTLRLQLAEARKERDEALKEREELEIRTRQRDYWQNERNKLRNAFDLAADRLRWCAANQIQFGFEEGAVGFPDRWIVYQKNRWDLPLGEGCTYEESIDAARSAAQPPDGGTTAATKRDAE